MPHSGDHWPQAILLLHANILNRRLPEHLIPLLVGELDVIGRWRHEDQSRCLHVTVAGRLVRKCIQERNGIVLLLKSFVCSFVCLFVCLFLFYSLFILCYSLVYIICFYF